VEFVEQGTLMGYGLAHPAGGPNLGLRLDPDRARAAAGFAERREEADRHAEADRHREGDRRAEAGQRENAEPGVGRLRTLGASPPVSGPHRVHRSAAASGTSGVSPGARPVADNSKDGAPW
jgi:hypothetical protein